LLTNKDRLALLRELAEMPSGAWVTCSGRSMEPTVRLADRVRVSGCERVSSGDVVLLETGAGDACILHRVVFRVPLLPYFAHMGDAAACRGAGLAHMSRLVGRADLERRPVALASRVAAAGRIAHAIGRRLWRLASQSAA
jgi:hypothetical protein